MSRRCGANKTDRSKEELKVQLRHNINVSVTSKTHLLVVPFVIVANMFLFINYPALDFAHNVLFGVKKKKKEKEQEAIKGDEKEYKPSRVAG